MTAKKLTISPTEADLEAEIHHAIALAFPWLPAESIRHQTKFSFTFGRKKIDVDGAEASRAEARSDIVLYNGDRPLAVLELKRAGVPLTPDDDAQGLSYARVLNPSSPLVVVTNGTDLHFVETHSGKRWQPAERSEQAFQALVASAARVAAADMKHAIETLMGTNAVVWMQAVRHTTAETMDEITASWDEPARPFARGFLIPRKAAAQVLRRAAEGAKLILVEGSPLAGKSNVLREISLRSEQLNEFATLYVEAGVGGGILQSLADTLARSLAWPVTREEARSWLMRVSQLSEHRLLLAIDSLDTGNNDTRREIEDLSSTTFGPGLSLIVAVDDSTAERIVATTNGLSESAIGRRAQRIKVGPLDDLEFQIAQRVLWRHRIGLMHGAQATPEFRQPWVLRAISAPVLERIEEADPSLAVALPSLLSLDLIRHARERFADPELRRLFKAIAKALLADTKDQQRDASLRLESLEINVVRRETLRQHVDATELTWLIDRGFVKPAIHASGDAVLFIRLPELLASELARLLADELAPLVQADAQDAATWIAGAASNLPIGDVIAAQAIFDAVHRPGSLSFDLIRILLETPPERQPVSPGGRFATHFPGVGLVELVFKEDGTAVVDIDGQLHTIDLGEDGMSDTYANIHQWLILSHLAAVPFAMETLDGLQRVDPGILLVVGTADIVLRKPGGDQEMRAAPTHELPGIGSMVCHEAGIIEPITLSIFRYLTRDGAAASDWIDAAIAADSMPLLGRIHIALLHASSSANEALARWAGEMLTLKVLPAFKLFPVLHGDGA
ncbi:type I restriction enzyme HsdR N-terminal domain-containing protein [Plasticicumulans sp.]|uniref:type I restriction enzyme HsdR N-terminal domain-containing protein n=1 Tax=Plasticicumulans sp. TaxID=2307179 RepID=UPI003220663E